MIEEILAVVKEHEKWRGSECLNLIPSENIMSSTVRTLLSSELGHRYTSREKFYMGTKFLDEIELYGEKIAKDVFRAETADLRPLSGHIADMIFLSTFTKPSDKILCVSPEDGGYPGIWKGGLAGLLGLRPLAFPFSKEKMRIEVEAAKELISREKPKVVVFGASFMLFPHPVADLAEVAREIDAIIGYDGSHVLGLIAGGEFQSPLREGACALFGSTHKTLFGPQGGIILAKANYGEEMKESIFPRFVDNAHWNRIAALTLALAEMKRFGKEYAKQVVRNAKQLAKALAEHGLPVVCKDYGFTSSHQVILDFGGFDNGREIGLRLERANIIVDCAVRLGTCEITRRGMKEAEMEKIAEFIKRILVDGEKPENVKEEVINFVKEFQKIHYCFDV
jgi:glycine hydroxymethyltransferase